MNQFTLSKLGLERQNQTNTLSCEMPFSGQSMTERSTICEARNHLRRHLFGHSRAEAEQAVARLIEITRARYDARLLMLDWLCTEFEVQEPGARLEDFTMLDEHPYVEEVRKHRAKTAGKLSPAANASLRVMAIDVEK